MPTGEKEKNWETNNSRTAATAGKLQVLVTTKVPPESWTPGSGAGCHPPGHIMRMMQKGNWTSDLIYFYFNIYVRKFPLCLLSGSIIMGVIINGCWILLKAFSASIEMIIWFFSFNLLIWFITLIDLHILKNPCIPGLNPTWSWCMILLMCCRVLFSSILLRIFASMLISDIDL